MARKETIYKRLTALAFQESIALLLFLCYIKAPTGHVVVIAERDDLHED